ncbi:MAG: hypothetical protein KA109_00775 [Saprospiraceae bacterium]|nr:hypothetical protein [Saprospiraceae bacterium]MBP7800130.1 hypothetical protein [Saprospiraceae bacterium]MBP8096341.1 hypothetical protein [Saprospiraceae bacterium]
MKNPKLSFKIIQATRSGNNLIFDIYVPSRYLMDKSTSIVDFLANNKTCFAVASNGFSSRTY